MWAQPIAVVSPDGYNKIEVSNVDKAIGYTVTTKDGSIVQSSAPMGFSFANAPDFRENLNMELLTRNTVDEYWTSPAGSSGKIRNHYNEATIEIRETRIPNQEEPKAVARKVQLIVRAYDDGVAFRFIFPENFSNDSIFITQEHTSFAFASSDSCYWAPYDDFAYESLYRWDAVASAKASSTPFTVKKQNGSWVSIHEAELVDYSEMYLKPIDSKAGSFDLNLHPWPDGIACRAKGEYQTPWRCVLIEKDAAGLITSNLVQNLNEPSAITDMSWIKPIRFVGIWWGMHLGKYAWSEGPKHGATTARAKQYIDFSAANGIEGVLVEGWNKGWETWASDKTPKQDFLNPTNDFNLVEVTNYAKAKGIQLIGHHETGGNIPEYEQQMEEAFSLYSKLGVRYVKTGYAGSIIPKGMPHHGQYMVRHFQKVVELAAKYQICLDVHESIKPTGLDRTWPNLLTQEAVKGNEWNATYKASLPSHAVTIPFTRGLAGPFDFTPGIFIVNHSPDEHKRIQSLITHQLAQCVVFNSPMLMFADMVENYDRHPLLPTLKHIHAQWDTTIALAALPGKHLAVARKDGDNWVVAALTGNGSASFQVSLSFLNDGINYKATLIHDVPTSNMDSVKQIYGSTIFRVSKNDSIPINMLPGGGFFMTLEPVNDATASASSDLEKNRYKTNAPKFNRIFAARPMIGENRISHMAVGKGVKRYTPFNEQYPASGPTALNDGLRGSIDYSDGFWQGYYGTGLDITIDLGIPDTLSKVAIGFLEAPSSWIFMPDEVELAYSRDGLVFQIL
ncbi:MAG: glycoside hydrolase family 97 protein, partial [Bacteroidota bacterium]